MTSQLRRPSPAASRGPLPEGKGGPQTLGQTHEGRDRRVLSILYQFPPSREVGAQSSVQICRYLPACGWDVTVLTVRERYIQDTDAQARDKFPGTVIRTGLIPHPLSFYRWLKAVRRGQVPQVADPTASSDSLQKAGALRRLLVSLLWIPDLYTGWIPPAVMSGLAAIRRQKVDCLFSSGPWWTNHLIGLVMAKLTGLPWIAHFRDSWAQGHWVKPVTNLSVRIEKALERQVLKAATAVVCVTDMQSAMLRRANPDLPASKFITIPNGYDDAEWTATPGDTTEPSSNDKFVITYAGNLYHGRSPYPLFRALQSLIEYKAIAREQVRVELLGKCDVAEGSRVMDVAAMHGLSDCVSTPGLVSRSEAVRRMKESNLLLLLVDEQNYSIPAKAYEYLRAGRPILALTTGGAVVDLFNQSGGAWVVDPTEHDAIKAAVLEAYLGWRSGVDARLPNQNVVDSYDRRVLTRRLADVFENTLPRAQAHTSLTAVRSE